MSIYLHNNEINRDYGLPQRFYERLKPYIDAHSLIEDREELADIWKSAITYREKYPELQESIAEWSFSVSAGSLLIKNDPLLDAIRMEFGSLEVRDASQTDADIERGWRHLAELISELSDKTPKTPINLVWQFVKDVKSVKQIDAFENYEAGGGFTILEVQTTDVEKYVCLFEDQKHVNDPFDKNIVREVELGYRWQVVGLVNPQNGQLVSKEDEETADQCYIPYLGKDHLLYQLNKN